MSMGWNETGAKLPSGIRPQLPLVNFAHPLAAGLVFCMDYSWNTIGPTHFDIVDHAYGVYTGTAPNTGPCGLERTFLGSTDSDKLTGLSARVQNLHKFTLEFIFKANVDTFMALFNKSSTASAGTASFFGVFWDDTSHCLSMSAGFSTTDGAWRDSNAVFLPNQFTHVVITYDDTTLSNVPGIWRNGVLQPVTTTSTPVGTRLADDATMQIGNFQTQAFGASADIVVVRLYNFVKQPGQILDLFDNPWQIYERPKLPLALLPGTVWAQSVAETSTATDTVTGAFILAAAMAETSTAADTPGASMVAANTISETGISTDTPNGGLVFTSAVTETGTAVDTPTGGLLSSNTISETGSAVDSLTGAFILAAVMAETGSAVDTPGGTLVFGEAMVEAGSAADVAGLALAITGIINEVVSATDQEDAALRTADAIAESSLIFDTVTNSAVIGTTIAETGSAADSETSSTPGNITIAEAGSATDTFTAQIIFAIALGEVGSAVDSPSAHYAIGGVMAEVGSAVDTVGQNATYNVGVAEGGAAQDFVTSAAIYAATVAEAGNAQDIAAFAFAVLTATPCNLLIGKPRVRLLSGGCC